MTVADDPPDEVVDAYSHVGLPRFQDLLAYETVMAGAGVSRAVLSAFSSSPDLDALHRAVSAAPGRYRAAGIPIGRSRDEVEGGVRAQADAGFTVLRLVDEDVLDRPWLLELMAERRMVVLVCGAVFSTEPGARVLVQHLERHTDAVVVGGHFGGPRDPQALASGAVRALFEHDRSAVVFSRHGAFPPEVVEPWARAVLALAGWAGVMWGAESPVLHWRNETIGSALSWIDRFGPSGAERAAYLGGNALRIFFARPVEPQALHMAFDPWEASARLPAQLWSNGLPVNQEIAGRLLQGWVSAGGPVSGPLGEYAERLLAESLPPLEGPATGRPGGLPQLLDRVDESF